RDESGRLVVNIELELHARGWRIAELRARFNAAPDAELSRRLTEWAALNLARSSAIRQPRACSSSSMLTTSRPLSSR
ncbi:hypothetical protein, partial [Nonomuraea sp. MG754425]|uniref:hypothetical protein n=1 Tax=Nonomuraea sp. MG754425 TaxID=2570319 RepID=UPI001F364C04